MDAIAGLIAERPDEGLRAVGRPVGPVVERARVPVRLVEDLGHGDGVGGRARVPVRVGHVALVVGRVQVDAVPARREPDRHHDAGGARRRREVQRLPAPRHRRLQAREVQVLVLGVELLRRPERRVPHRHPEPRLERRRRPARQVVHRLPAARPRVPQLVAERVHLVEGAILRAIYLFVSYPNPSSTWNGKKRKEGSEPEEQRRRPVVREVFGGRAGGARSRRRQVVCGVVHRLVEGISADDLVEVRRWVLAGVDEATM